MEYDYARPRPNPMLDPRVGLGTALGIAAGVGATFLGAWGASKLMDRKLAITNGKRPVPTPAPAWLSEVEAVLVPNATVGDNDLPLPVPGVAFNTLGVQDVEGPTRDQFPRVTQPVPPLLMKGKEGTRIPLEFFYALSEGDVGFKIDTDALLQRGIAYDVTPEATYADGTHEGAVRQYQSLVTNLSRPLVVDAMNAAYAGATQRNDDYSVPSGTRDNLVRSVLSAAVPSFDWSAAPQNLGGPETGPRLLWDGVSLIAQITYQAAQ